MILYADTSSLVKLYISEEGSDEMAQVSFGADEVASSKVAYAELRVALARALRGGRIVEGAFQTARRKFDREWADLAVVDVSDDILQRAGDLGDRHPIRGFDAIHLASATAFRDERITSEVWFASADRRLRDAAAAEDFTVAP